MDIAGNRASNISPSGVGLTMITTTFGPRYTWSHTLRGEFQKRISLFGQTLIGEAHGLDSTFPSPAAAQSDANVFALQTGGGVDLAFSRHFAIRPLEANWLRTQFPNGASNIQTASASDPGSPSASHSEPTSVSPALLQSWRARHPEAAVSSDKAT